ncbi:hypothetical protein DYH10_00230 [Candidatus Saccharibacteria bacterium CPR2]|nr:hypothetical protein [Candidatus Saccharibacteria bacterium CPR2]
MIKAVVFDFGGVLSTGGTLGSGKKYISEYFDIPFEKLNTDDLYAELRKGKISSKKFLEFVKSRHDIQKDVDHEHFWRNQNIFNRNEKVYKLAKLLRKLGIKTAIFSNVFQPSSKLLREKGYYHGFDPVVLSHEEGLEKPDSDFFKILLKKLNCKPTQVVLIDDQEKNQLPATKLGIHFILAVNAEQISADVKKILEIKNKIIL